MLFYQSDKCKLSQHIPNISKLGIRQIDIKEKKWMSWSNNHKVISYIKAFSSNLKTKTFTFVVTFSSHPSLPPWSYKVVKNTHYDPCVCVCVCSLSTGESERDF